MGFSTKPKRHIEIPEPVPIKFPAPAEPDPATPAADPSTEPSEPAVDPILVPAREPVPAGR